MMFLAVSMKKQVMTADSDEDEEREDRSATRPSRFSLFSSSSFPLRSNYGLTIPLLILVLIPVHIQEISSNQAEVATLGQASRVDVWDLHGTKHVLCGGLVGEGVDVRVDGEGFDGGGSVEHEEGGEEHVVGELVSLGGVAWRREKGGEGR